MVGLWVENIIIVVIFSTILLPLDFICQAFLALWLAWILLLSPFTSIWLNFFLVSISQVFVRHPYCLLPSHCFVLRTPESTGASYLNLAIWPMDEFRVWMEPIRVCTRREFVALVRHILKHSTLVHYSVNWWILSICHFYKAHLAIVWVRRWRSTCMIIAARRWSFWTRLWLWAPGVSIYLWVRWILILKIDFTNFLVGVSNEIWWCFECLVEVAWPLRFLVCTIDINVLLQFLRGEDPSNF